MRHCIQKPHASPARPTSGHASPARLTTSNENQWHNITFNGTSQNHVKPSPNEVIRSQFVMPSLRKKRNSLPFMSNKAVNLVLIEQSFKKDVIEGLLIFCGCRLQEACLLLKVY